jgi:molybdenum cofactor cytidylyltransferase
MTFAIIPAAGHSTRMGQPKLALPLGDRTVLEHVIAALRGGGVEHVLVVIGPHVSELAPLANAAGAEVCPLPEPTADMRTTVEHGLRWLEDRYHPRPDDYWVLAPGDHPSFGASVVSALLAVAGTGGKSIVVPVHGSRRGHPTVIAWSHVAGIRALSPDEGINAYLRMHGAETLEVPVGDAGILDDLDTPTDLDRLRARRFAG